MPTAFCVKNYNIKMYCNTQFKKNLRFQVSESKTSKNKSLSSFHDFLNVSIEFCVKNYAIKMYCNTKFQKKCFRFKVSEAETSQKPKN